MVSAALAETSSAPAPVGARHTFSAVGSDLETWRSLVAGETTGRISRREALSVPSVLRARNLICSTIAMLPLHATNGAGERVEHKLLETPEGPVGLVRSVSLANLLEDLLFESSACWLVLLRTSAGFPTAVQRIEHGKWQIDPVTRVVTVEGREVDPRDVIIFSSPNPPLLVHGARAIRSLLLLEESALRLASEPEASYWFRSADGVDPAEDDVLAVLNGWKAARKKRAVAYVPSAYQVEKADRQTGEELQMVSAREFAVAEIARLTGLSSEWLNVSTTSRTYLNAVDERRQFVDFVLGPLLVSVEQRLSLPDVTPRGQDVRFSLDAFLRADSKTRMETYEIGLRVGAYAPDEIRALEDRPPLEAQ